MSNEFNPYSSPSQAGFNPTTGYSPAPIPQHRLASLGARFLGSLLDGLASIVFVGPGLAMLLASGVLQEGQEPEFNTLMLVGLLLAGAGMIALLVLQLYLLATRSQSVGKYLVKTQMVDYQTGQPAGFAKCFLLRSLLNGLIAQIPFVGGLYALVDILFIFGEERRCLHDLIAGTSVVDIS